jgi:hypothetical protein
MPTLSTTVTSYGFASQPLIEAYYSAEAGRVWTPWLPVLENVSPSYLRSLRIKRVTLTDGTRHADFAVSELFASERPSDSCVECGKTCSVGAMRCRACANRDNAQYRKPRRGRR